MINLFKVKIFGLTGFEHKNAFELSFKNYNLQNIFKYIKLALQQSPTN